MIQSLSGVEIKIAANNINQCWSASADKISIVCFASPVFPVRRYEILDRIQGFL
ncbi:hypothetical protein K4039_26575 [Lyngbya sp. CCAP 1446/10]|uniref:hypothetical protein n=1 Tax=Lyngbya sp. CCAP 1446/10 TaxID=439293 RepID=UPI002237DBA4|nr:hypothetical protein [Lyngbya sp. CCAP 1446/10]MCW6053522.1 hypothetical protein [Lyngbya sp. CCAP 1446/10]